MPPSPKLTTTFREGEGEDRTHMYGGKTIKGLLFAVLFELAVIALLLRQTWYKSDANPVETFSADPPDHTRAIAILRGESGVNGTVYFRQHAPWGPVRVTGTISGLDARSFRGFHIHQFGDLSDGCTSTSSHFNPASMTHGAPTDRVRHVGDLGNVQTDEDGVAELDFKDAVISLQGPWSIVGRAVVVHKGEDDLGRGDNEESKKTGNAGGRAACGVIGLMG